MIFLDTSGILALAMEADEFHERAFEMMGSVETSGQKVCTHSYVLVEAAALMHRRIGLDVALAFLRSAEGSFDVVWVDSALHSKAVKHLEEHGSVKLSLVDAVSFLVMRSRSVTEYIGFDKHFTDAGFRQYLPKDSRS